MSNGSQWPHWIDQVRGERPSGDAGQLEIWGYVGRPSYAARDTLNLHVSTSAGAFEVRIYRDGAEREVVHHASGLPGALHSTPDDAYATGCGWPATVGIAIPDSWRPGAYVVEFSAHDERGTAMHEGFFVLRPIHRATESRVAVVLATYTWQAYNDWGGGSAYSLDARRNTGSEFNERSLAGFSPRLSFSRPWGRGLIRLPIGAPRMTLKDPPPMGWAPRYPQAEWALANGYSHWTGCAGWAQYDSLFVRWAEQQGYALDVLTQWDLDRDPTCLEPYACVVTVGHDEYWTATGRRALDRFIEQGGRYARLAGNIFFQVRLEDGGMTQVCHKYLPETDPLAGSEDRGRRTGAFESLAIADPPVTTFGANGARGSYSRWGGFAPRGVGGFIVYRNDHWVFEGTDLYFADVLGSSVPLVGYESDGLSYTFDRGRPIPTGEDGAPAGLEILALTPVTMQEEDHGIAGTRLLVGDTDIAFFAELHFGSDTPEHREEVCRGSAVMTWMPKGAGEVVCGGSTEWPYALAQGEPMVERVVRNILDRFSAR